MVGYEKGTIRSTGRVYEQQWVQLLPLRDDPVVRYPMNVATEYMRELAPSGSWDISDFQTPLYVGRAAAALLANGDLMRRTGTIEWVEDLAEKFDLLDEHGRRPPGSARRAELER